MNREEGMLDKMEEMEKVGFSLFWREYVVVFYGVASCGCNSNRNSDCSNGFVSNKSGIKSSDVVLLLEVAALMVVVVVIVVAVNVVVIVMLIIVVAAAVVVVIIV